MKYSETMERNDIHAAVFEAVDGLIEELPLVEEVVLTVLVGGHTVNCYLADDGGLELVSFDDGGDS